MTPAPTNSSDAEARLASADFAEQFVTQSEHAHLARRASSDAGIEPITPVGAEVLTMFARLLGAKAAVEVGTGTGVSGLAILAGLAPDGILTSIDPESEHQQAARKVFADAGFAARRARLIAGAALTVLPKLSDAAYDLVFVDGDPLETVEYVAQAARLLRPGGVLIVNHAFAGGGVADDANEDDDTVITREMLDAATAMDEFSPVLLPVGDGLLVSVRA